MAAKLMFCCKPRKPIPCIARRCARRERPCRCAAKPGDEAAPFQSTKFRQVAAIQKGRSIPEVGDQVRTWQCGISAGPPPVVGHSRCFRPRRTGVHFRSFPEADLDQPRGRRPFWRTTCAASSTVARWRIVVSCHPASGACGAGDFDYLAEPLTSTRFSLPKTNGSRAATPKVSNRQNNSM